MPDPTDHTDALMDAVKELLQARYRDLISREDFVSRLRNLLLPPFDLDPTRAEKPRSGLESRAHVGDTRQFQPVVNSTTITLVDTSNSDGPRFKAFDDRDQALGFAMARMPAEVFEIELIAIDEDVPF